MIEIKAIGRGGEGAVTFSHILAISAFEEGYKVVQAMPSFGVERRGAPSFSFTRISKEDELEVRSEIYNPDIVVVFDPTLLKSIDVTEGLKKNGMLIINSKKSAEELDVKGRFEVRIVDATSVALKLFGRNIVNTAMLGAFSAATKLVSIESIYKAIEQTFEKNPKLIDLNKQAVKETYENVK